MKRSDLISVIFLIAAALIIYYPLFHSEYLYTDESGELWFGRKGMDFEAFIFQGRHVTYRLFVWLFSPVHTVHGVLFPRAFSLFGWMTCIPVWYIIIDKLVTGNGLPKMLGFLSMVYLICMPPFMISIGWASVLEHFVACTGGLVSGYIMYRGLTIKEAGRYRMAPALILSLLFGLLSLFTYQNCFGCYFISFLIPLLATKKISRTILLGMGGGLVIYIIYFFLFKITIGMTGVAASSRSALCTDPAGKLIFFFSRPMAMAFHFTLLFNEKSLSGRIVYLILAAAWLILYLVRYKTVPVRGKFLYLSGLSVLFALLYLPSLIVKENYSSNRTLLALDLAVFFLVAETLFDLFKKARTRYILTEILVGSLLINAGYNFRKEFLDPLTAEYQTLQDYVSLHLEPTTSAVYVIRPQENGFVKKYGIVASWDEFGVPSMAKPWTPEPLIKQLVFERTASMARADSMIVKSWPDKMAYRASGDTLSKGILLIDADSLLAAQ